MSERNELDMATSSTNPVNHIMNLMRRRPVPKKQAMVSVSVGITDNIGNVPMDDAIRRRIIERSVVRMNDMVEEADTSEPDIVQPIIKNIKKKGVGKIPKKAVEVNAEPLVDNENREPHDDNSTQPAQPAQPTQPIARTTPRPQTLPIREGPVSQIQLTDNQFTDHFPNRDTTNHTRLKGSQYYLTDRENFISFINTLFEPYKKQLAELESSSQLSCDRMGDAGKDFSLLFHQEVVKEYINLHTPYR